MSKALQPLDGTEPDTENYYMNEFMYVTVKNYKQPGDRLNSLELLPIDGWIYFFTS